jgi:sulfoxide reductase heme-binding subunit YedZ
VKISWSKVVVFLVCLLPLGLLAWKAVQGVLGANPIEVITHATGDWTLRFLLITLAVTPVRQVTRQYWLIRYRRMFGLFAFFYGFLHLTTYVWLDQFFDVHSMIKDIAKRPFITIGFTAFCLMIPLAVTSTRKMIQRLGGRRWQWLHRLIYLAATAGVIHFLWLVKKDKTRPLEYGLILGLLLTYRLAVWGYSRVKAGKRIPAGTAEAAAD